MTTYEIQGYTPDEMSTGEKTGAAKLKWVVIVDKALSPGQAVKAAVCVASATAPAVAGLLGPDMPAAAQATRVYDDYLRELAKTEPAGLDLAGGQPDRPAEPGLQGGPPPRLLA